MRIARFARHNAVDETDLQQAGFTAEEIVLLVQLRDHYPLPWGPRVKTRTPMARIYQVVLRD